MAYNNGFPATYPQFYPQYQQPQYQQQAQTPQPQPNVPQQSNPMIWVQGEAGAKSYLLAPNTTAPLWDSEAQTIYIKSTDASGMPSMKILDYTIRDNAVHSTNKIIDADYVTKDELSEFKTQIIEMVKKELEA